MSTPSYADLKTWDHAHVWHPFTQMRDWLNEDPIVIAKGEGNYLIDVHGNRYLPRRVQPGSPPPPGCGHWHSPRIPILRQDPSAPTPSGAPRSAGRGNTAASLPGASRRAP